MFILPLFANADEGCRAKINFKFDQRFDSSTRLALKQITENYVTSHSDVIQSSEHTDYLATLTFRTSLDPHSGRVSPVFNFSASVAGNPEHESSFGQEYFGRWTRYENALSVKNFKGPLNKALSKYLSSCYALKHESEAKGDGTLVSYVGQKITLPSGAIFERVEFPATGPLRGLFGNAWKAPNGMVWSQALPEKYDNLDMDGTAPINGQIQKSKATEACKAVGGVLPSFAQYDQFRKYFGSIDWNDSLSERSQHLMHALFPWERAMFWTSTAATNTALDGTDFFHENGMLSGSSQRWWKLDVRCIGSSN